MCPDLEKLRSDVALLVGKQRHFLVACATIGYLRDTLAQYWGRDVGCVSELLLQVIDREQPKVQRNVKYSPIPPNGDVRLPTREMNDKTWREGVCHH